MNVAPTCYSCRNRTTKVKNEFCKMRKLAAGVNSKFQGWRDELAFAYHGVQTVLEKRFTCNENGKLPCQKVPLIDNLLGMVDVGHAQRIADLIHERP